jgi:hypothetical protein
LQEVEKGEGWRTVEKVLQDQEIYINTKWSVSQHLSKILCRGKHSKWWMGRNPDGEELFSQSEKAFYEHLGLRTVRKQSFLSKCVLPF